MILMLSTICMLNSPCRALRPWCFVLWMSLALWIRRLKTLPSGFFYCFIYFYNAITSVLRLCLFAITLALKRLTNRVFYSRETGGTIVSGALKLMAEIIAQRYPASQWNIYGAQASDGDNWNDDSSICLDLLNQTIMPQVQYFSYLEITSRNHQALWTAYEQVLAAYPEVLLCAIW